VVKGGEEEEYRCLVAGTKRGHRGGFKY